MKIFAYKDVGALYELLESRTRRGNAEISGRVASILARVAEGGDAAVKAVTRETDGVELASLELPAAELDRLAAQTPPALYETMEKAAANIRRYHEKQKSTGYELREPGRLLGRIVRPLRRVGVYVPGGTAAYPSTVLMNCIPAAVAGGGEIVIATPPKRGGIAPAVAAAAKIAGVGRVVTVGGAQAVAALAYGTETLPRVDKIVGPGNIYVAEAKKQLFGRVDIDMIAGPSEVLIVADESADAEFAAADLLSQLEHDAFASAILVTTSAPLAERVGKALEAQAAKLSRTEIVSQSLGAYCAAVLCGSLDEAFAVANEVAPEHLEILTADPSGDLARVRNAGSVFLGAYTPEPLGDYFAGTNHVLPTNGTARFSSPLSVDDFVKKMSYLQYDRASLLDAAADIIRFAECEGLDAHAESVRIRTREKLSESEKLFEGREMSE